MTADDLFTIEAGRWYAWQMLPAYSEEDGVPYLSPIFVHEIKPLKTGKGTIYLRFFNAHYAAGLEDFELEMRVLKRAKRYLVADLMYDDRCAIISPMTIGWLRRFFPSLPVPDDLPTDSAEFARLLARIYCKGRPSLQTSPASFAS